MTGRFILSIFHNIVAFAAFIFLFSCNKDHEFTIGDEFLESGSRLVVIDTVTTALSTVALDSFYTSETGLALLGSHEDSICGKIYCSSYFRIGLPASSDIQEKDIYDSTALILRYSGYSYGDTLKEQTLSVYKLTEPIKAYEDGYCYNTTSFNHSGTPVGIKKFISYSNREDSILTIKINDNVGLELWTMLKENSDFVSSHESFINYFPGFVLLPEENQNTAVFGFNASDEEIILRIYSHRIEDEVEEITTDFTLADANVQFNNIRVDYSNTSLKQKFKQETDIPYSQTSGYSYIQGGTGLMAKIRFPYLMDLLLLENAKLMKAELVFKPAIQSYSFDFPENLTINLLDKHNSFLGSFYDVNGDLITASFVYDRYFHEETSYTFDISNYLLNEFENSYYDNEKSLGIMLHPNNFYTSLERVLIEGGVNGPKLKLYYIFY